MNRKIVNALFLLVNASYIFGGIKASQAAHEISVPKIIITMKCILSRIIFETTFGNSCRLFQQSKHSYIIYITAILIIAGVIYLGLKTKNKKKTFIILAITAVYSSSITFFSVIARDLDISYAMQTFAQRYFYIQSLMYILATLYTITQTTILCHKKQKVVIGVMISYAIILSMFNSNFFLIPSKYGQTIANFLKQATQKLETNYKGKVILMRPGKWHIILNLGNDKNTLTPTILPFQMENK